MESPNKATTTKQTYSKKNLCFIVGNTMVRLSCAKYPTNNIFHTQVISSIVLQDFSFPPLLSDVIQFFVCFLCRYILYVAFIALRLAFNAFL